MLQHIEKAVHEFLETKFSQTVYKLWFQDMKLTELTEEKAVFTIPNRNKQSIIESKHSQTLRDALFSACGFSVAVEIVSDEPEGISLEEAIRRQNSQKRVEEMLWNAGEPKEDSPLLPKAETKGIISEYTFDNFIVGETNKFAHAACVAVAKSLNAYNPLFIHGPSGLGKTHLMYAVMNFVKKRDPSAYVIYKKGEEFTNELIEAIQSGSMVAFREKYRTADLLLIDDIQFIAGKESTQEEFFHTFNALYESEKQIILTSDRPPKDIKTLEDRLCTRFEWGLLADIQPPSVELRQAIIQKKAESKGLPLSPQIIAFLAEKLQSNIRQLEGSIKKLSAISALTGTPVSMEMTKRAISDILSGEEPVSITVEKILQAVSKKYNVPVDQIKSKKRTQNIVFARHVSVYLIREITSLPFETIGEILGGRDHSTIHSSYTIIESRMEQKDFADQIGELRAPFKK